MLAPSRIIDITVYKDVTPQGEPILNVTWTAPQSDVNISQYQVQYKRNATVWWTNEVIKDSSITAAILSEVTAGTAYNIRVRAQSAVEDGEWSDVLTETTYNSEFTCCYQFHIRSCCKPLSKTAGKQRLSNCIFPVA